MQPGFFQSILHRSPRSVFALSTSASRVAHDQDTKASFSFGDGKRRSLSMSWSVNRA